MPEFEQNRTCFTFQSVKAAELRVFDQVMPQVQFAPSITHIVQGREKMCENNGPGYLVNTILRRSESLVFKVPDALQTPA